MVGHKLGEFSPTRQFSGHTPADKKAAQTAESEGAAPGKGTAPGSAPGAASGAAKPATETKTKEGSTNAKKWKFS